MPQLIECYNLMWTSFCPQHGCDCFGFRLRCRHVGEFLHRLLAAPFLSWIRIARQNGIETSCAFIARNVPKPAIHSEKVGVDFRFDASDDAVVRVNRYSAV